jgi:hypothetical protein
VLGRLADLQPGIPRIIRRTLRHIRCVVAHDGGETQ